MSCPRRPGSTPSSACGWSRLLALAAFVAATVVVWAAAPPAPAQVVLGFGDQAESMFSDHRWTALGFREVRRLVEWDTFKDPRKTAELDSWLRAAQLAGVRPLIAFDRSWTSARPRQLPTRAQYKHLVRTFRAQYPWVRQFSPWNEANMSVQPTYRHPRAAAAFYRILRRECPGCTVTSPVILPTSNAARWVARFRRLLNAPLPRIWAVNDYGDFNRGTDTLLRRMKRLLPGRIWVTETGGWVRFGRRLRHDERRASRAYRVIFRMLDRHRHRVKRWYFYQWHERPHDPYWDSGLIAFDGRPRLAYRVLRNGLRLR